MYRSPQQSAERMIKAIKRKTEMHVNKNGLAKQVHGVHLKTFCSMNSACVSLNSGSTSGQTNLPPYEPLHIHESDYFPQVLTEKFLGLILTPALAPPNGTSGEELKKFKY